MLMQSGKCPGPDGLPGEYHKTFSDQLAPILLNMFNESMQNGILPTILWISIGEMWAIHPPSLSV